MGFKVLVANNSLHFAASHFITYGGKCERLHGHNYSVSLELEGDLTPDGYVFDFVELKRIARLIVETLDHRFLLAMDNPHLQIRRVENTWEICFREKRYVLPDQDVRPLPVDNITAERLAEYIWGETARELNLRGARNLTILTIGVEEAAGQSAYFSQRLGLEKQTG